MAILKRINGGKYSGLYVLNEKVYPDVKIKAKWRDDVIQSYVSMRQWCVCFTEFNLHELWLVDTLTNLIITQRLSRTELGWKAVFINL